MAQQSAAPQAEDLPEENHQAENQQAENQQAGNQPAAPQAKDLRSRFRDFLEPLTRSDKRAVLKFLAGFSALVGVGMRGFFIRDILDMLRFVKDKFGENISSVLNMITLNPADFTNNKLLKSHADEIDRIRQRHADQIDSIKKGHTAEIIKIRKEKEDLPKIIAESEKRKEGKTWEKLIDVIGKNEQVLKLGVGGMFFITLALGAYKSWPYIRKRWIESSGVLTENIKSRNSSSSRPKHPKSRGSSTTRTKHSNKSRGSLKK